MEEPGQDEPKGARIDYLKTAQSPGRRQVRAAGVVNRDLPAWYRALFSPSVQVGLSPAHALNEPASDAKFL